MHRLLFVFRIIQYKYLKKHDKFLAKDRPQVLSFLINILCSEDIHATETLLMLNSGKLDSVI